MAGIRDHILILEDDSTLLNALSEAFKKEGFHTHLSSSPEQALHLLKTQPIGIIFLDCLLPGQSGVEFIQSIRQEYPPAVLEVIYMSGIFVDPLFMKEALRSTKAKHFLRKPFELTEALALVDRPLSSPTAVTNQKVSPRKSLYELFSKGQVTQREKRKAIESLEQIHGFDLPYIYSLLVESRTSGSLNIVTESAAVYGITFSHGNITRVDIPDQETYIGKMLVEGGYIHPDDLSKAFEDKSSNKRIGERLISSFYVSPHALNLVLGQQMNVRISKIITDQPLKINFAEGDNELIEPHINPEQFRNFLHDWIASKIDLSWLKAHFMQWVNSPLVKTPLYTDDHSALQMPLVKVHEGLVSYLTSGATFGQILDSQKYPDDIVLKSTHYLLARGLLVFAQPKAQLTATDRLKYLKKLHVQFAGLNKLDAYDLLVKLTGAQESNPDIVIAEFQKVLGTPPSDQEKEQKSLYDQMASLSAQAYQLAKSGNRSKLKEEMQKDEIDLRMKASQIYEDAKNLLQKSLYKQAFDQIKKAQAIDQHLPKIKIYYNWAQLGLLDQSAQKEQLLKKVESDLLQVPPEEKFDAIYSFVLGLLSKSKKDMVSARRHFEKAIALDSQLIVAKRELTALASVSEKNKDIFNRDLKEVVGSIFRKK